MTPEEYQQRMAATGIERGKLGPGGHFLPDQGQNPSVGHEPCRLKERPATDKAAEPVEDLSYLNPRESGRHRAYLKRLWAGMTVDERRARTEQLRRNGSAKGAKA
jgi:hypothetical protein